MRCVAGLVIILCVGLASAAQSYFYKDNIIEPDWLLEAGAGAGWLHCRTDLGGRKGPGVLAIDWKAGRPAVSFFAMVTYRHLLGIRIQLFTGSLGAADSLIGSGGPGSRYDRNLHFQSPIREATVLLEVYPFSLAGITTTGRVQWYVYAGLGYFRFNPRAQLQNGWTTLQPLHTEGQGFHRPDKKITTPYNLRQLTIPIGTGLRCEAGPYLHFRLEGLYRILFTDYLDDVSTYYADPLLFHQFLPPEKAALAHLAADRRKTKQPFQVGVIRGNPGRNDAYFHLQLSCAVLINRKKRI